MEFENVKNVLNDFGKYLVEEYKEQLILSDSNASDQLYNSLSYIVSNNGTTFEVKLELMDYWKWLENGRKAGKMPPINAIKQWVEVKPVIPRPMSNGKLPTVNQLAYLIARKIGLEGTIGKHLLQTSVDNVWGVFEEFIAEAFVKDLEKDFELDLGVLRN